MLLEGKNAVIYGGGGSIGGAVAKAFAREGARVFLAGRTKAKLDAVAEEIGDAAETAEVDALDEAAVDAHADAIPDGIDISFNVIGLNDVQGRRWPRWRWPTSWRRSTRRCAASS